MPSVSFVIPGKPRGKGRPRFSRHGHAYTPAETRDYERRVADAAKAAMRDKDMLHGVCEVLITAHGGICQSMPKGKAYRIYGEPWPGKPDADNIAKVVCDACNGIVWRDDCQIWSLQVVKLYADDARVEVEVSWDEEDQKCAK